MIRLIVIASLLGGCATTTVDTSCTAFKPIAYSAAGDTEVTKGQIRGHNAAWKQLCG